MGVVVSFDYTAWVARYPEFSTVTEGLATQYFTEATLYHRNDGGGPVGNSAMQSLLLNMLTAHICKLNATINGVAPSPLIGRINTASEGSVSVATENSYPPGTVQWYQQTQYGSSYWAATAQFRSMHYRAPMQRNFDPLYR